MVEEKYSENYSYVYKAINNLNNPFNNFIVIKSLMTSELLLYRSFKHLLVSLILKHFQKFQMIFKSFIDFLQA